MGDDQDDVVMVPLDTALTRLMQTRCIGSIEMSAVSEDLMDQAQSEVDQHPARVAPARPPATRRTSTS